ncbi:hypothetical protein GCM10027563_23870 [Parasphingorhabdus pacifica]
MAATAVRYSISAPAARAQRWLRKTLANPQSPKGRHDHCRAESGQLAPILLLARLAPAVSASAETRCDRTTRRRRCPTTRAGFIRRITAYPALPPAGDAPDAR